MAKDAQVDLGIASQKEKIHGTLVLSFDFQSGILTDSPVGNTVYWNATKEQMNIRPKLYWHECYGIRTSVP
jgi:hypothetical protein